MPGREPIAARLRMVRAQIAEAAALVGRDPGEITLVAVSKRISVAHVGEAVAAGQEDFGENYLQEALPKIEALADSRRLRWHLIGGLQANKAGKAARNFDLLHSVCSESVAQRISREAAVLGRSVRVLIQVKLGGGATRAGVEIEETQDLAAKICACSGVLLDGVMGVPPLGEQPRPYFRKLLGVLQGLRAIGLPQAPLREMSAGMSGDFRDAIVEGATIVRIGEAIFGSRAE